MVGYQAESIEAATFPGLKETLLRSETGGCEAANSDQTGNYNQDDGEEPLQLLGNQISDLDLLYIGLALTSADMIGDDGAGETTDRTTGEMDAFPDTSFKLDDGEEPQQLLQR